MNEANTEVAEKPEAGGDVNETEQRARRLGWVAQDEFKGDPERWRPATEFLEKGETLLPVARADNRRLHDQLDRTSREMGEMRTVMNELRDFANSANERAHKQARAEIEAEMRNAVASADQGAFEVAKARLDNLAPPPKPATPAAPAQPELDPVAKEWIDRNDWFRDDFELNAYATAHHNKLSATRKDLSLRDNLAAVEREVKARFPDKFNNGRRDAPSAVSSPGGAPQAARKPGKVYDNLPADARAACDRFMRQIPGYSREEYCKSYDWTGVQV